MSQHPLQAFRERQTPPWTVDDLAQKLEVARVTVWRWEKGERFPDRELWPKIKAITGVSVSDLVEAA